MGAVYDSGDYEKALDHALNVAGWEQLERERDAARADGRLVGLGLSMYVESCGLGPSSYPFGCHIVMLEVDRETGEPRLLKMVAVDDAGHLINPLIVEGQIHGGLAQGIGQALIEEVAYDADGQPLTASFMDYALPRASDFPRFELDNTVTPTPVNPLGAKGVGEAGTIGSTPCIVNATVDALSGFGVRHLDMMLRPEKLWRIVHGHQQARSSDARSR